MNTARVTLSAIAASALLACADTTPVIVLDQGGDAAIDAPDASSALTACVACLTAPDTPGPGCADEVNACLTNDHCKATLDCAVVSGCFLAATREDLIKCGTDCTDKAGIKSSSDPGVALAAALDGCIEVDCATVCPAYSH